MSQGTFTTNINRGQEGDNELESSEGGSFMFKGGKGNMPNEMMESEVTGDL